MAIVSTFGDYLSENSCVTHLNQLSLSIQKWTDSVNDLVLVCKQMSDANRDLNCLSSMQHLPPVLERGLWLNSLKLKLGSAVERSFELMSRLRTTTLNVFGNIESVESELYSIAKTKNVQDSWIHLSLCSSLIRQFRCALADECDAIASYHMRTVYTNGESNIPSSLSLFDPDLPVISRLWSESYFPVFQVLLS